jgi:hypothetical protein
MSKLLDQLFEEFTKREHRGFIKYGTTMDRKDLSLEQWVQHLKEELMDGLLYLQKIQNDTQEHTNNQKTSTRATKNTTSD